MSLLTKGDWDNLAGKVLVYAPCFEVRSIESVMPGIVACYSSNDMLDFIEKVDPPKEYVDEAERKVKAYDSKMARSGQEGGHAPMFRMYCATLYIPEKEDLAWFSHDADTIALDPYYEAHHAESVVTSTIFAYSARLEELFERREDLQDALKRCSQAILTHADFAGKPIAQHLFTEYVAPMVHAKQVHDDYSLKNLQSRVLKFSAGSGFLRDSIQLNKELAERSREPVISSLVGKIDAIHLEDYERARKMSDALKQYM